ncbi:MAG: hypothetical protein WA941_07515 [Nitrososphaeraceae archaeon]
MPICKLTMLMQVLSPPPLWPPTFARVRASAPDIGSSAYCGLIGMVFLVYLIE